MKNLYWEGQFLKWVVVSEGISS